MTAGVLAIASSTIAQTATQADIDACNKMAQASTALSRGSASGASEATHPGGLESNRQRNSSGRLSPSASPRTSAADARLNGMAATGHGIAAYQQSYRDCMKERGF